MTFYVIFTPQSVKYLYFLNYSLLLHSDYNYCLVSNGCSQKEQANLRYFTQANEKLTYHCFPTNKMKPHGIILDYLQTLNQGKYFCFLDSDIFATAKLPNLLKIMEDKKLTGLFSAMPLWVKQDEYIFEENFTNMLGTYNQTQNGQCLGSTYFAIYHSDHLSEITQFYGLSFLETSSQNLPIHIQNDLKKMGYQQNGFDTGKVINLFLNKHKYQLQNIELPQLCHIGGTSYETTYRSRQPTFQQKIKSTLQKSSISPLIDAYSNYRQKRSFRRRFQAVSAEEFKINYNQRVLHRDPTRQHFLDLFLALKDNKELPLPPQFKDAEITNNVKKAHDAYILNFKKYYQPI